MRQGSSWVIFGYAVNQVIRLGGNLLLTRLLFPEVFGLGALVASFRIGLEMFSDMGIRPSLLQHTRYNDSNFVNTAWTLQVVRGFCLWFCAILISYPFSLFYHDQRLVALIMVSGATAAIAGLNSTGLILANRNLRLRRITIIELASQLSGLIVMVGVAYFYHSVWALIIGGLVATLVKMILSHKFLTIISHKLAWEKEALNDLIRFGRWLFLGTALTFFVGRADRLLLGKFLSLSDLGLFSLASMITMTIDQLLTKLGGQIFLPIYSKYQDAPKTEFREKVKKNKIMITCLLLPLIICMSSYGQEIVNLFFDDRYTDSGWMLQVMACGWVVVVVADIGPFYLAFGDSKLHLKITSIKAVLVIGSMIVGGYFWGTTGLICSIPLSKVLFYPFQVIILSRYSLWFPVFDSLAIVGSYCAIVLLLWAKT